MDGFWPRRDLLRRWKPFIQATVLLLAGNLAFNTFYPELFSLHRTDRPLHRFGLDHQWYLDNYGGWLDLVIRPGVRRDLFPAFLVDVLQGYLAMGIWIMGCWWVCLLALEVAKERIARHRPTAARPCPHCGYDLRATPDRCPECGHRPDSPALVEPRA